MKISKEFPPPVKTEYKLILSEDEFQVLRAALAVADFKKVNDRINYKVLAPDNIVYRMFVELDGFNGK